MEVNIRKIDETNAEALEKITKQTFFDTFTGTCTEEDMQQFLNKAFNPEQLKSELADSSNLYYFAEIDDVPAGYLQLMEDYTGFAEIKKWKALELKRIYVDKAFHGKGIAQSLIQFAEKYARENDYEVLWLGVWEYNERAKRFYEKCGFENSQYTHDFPIGNTPQTDNYYWKFLK